MTPKRWLQLEFGGRTRLTRKEIKRGYHYCIDWDGMLISYSMLMEYGTCTCAYCPSKTKRRRIIKRATKYQRRVNAPFDEFLYMNPQLNDKELSTLMEIFSNPLT